ncbi:MAG: hypothetical protein SFY32_02655 [Bacteroidota bacterium]|nr:hypothetical protein [Bacteroidota bacterium]
MNIRSTVVFIFIFGLIISSLTVYADEHVVCFDDESKQTTIQELVGIIIEYKSNSAGDIDAFDLKLEDKVITILFMPHSANALMAIAEKGTKVKVKVEFNENHNHYSLSNLENTLNSKRLDITCQYPSWTNNTGSDQSILFAQHYFITDRKGRIAGIANGKTLAIFKPNSVNNLIELIKSNSKVKITGPERPKDKGYVNTKFDLIIYTTSIEIDGTTFLLK